MPTLLLHTSFLFSELMDKDEVLDVGKIVYKSQKSTLFDAVYLENQVLCKKKSLLEHSLNT